MGYIPPLIAMAINIEPEPYTFASWLAGLLSRWKLAVGVAGGVVFLAVLVGLLAPPVYRARASFVTASSGLRLPSGLAGFAAQLGVGSGGEPAESPAFYTSLLYSRELLTRLVKSRFADPRTEEPGDSASLIEILKIRADDPERAVEVAIENLADRMRVTPDARTNLVHIAVDSRWPELSSAIANRLVFLVGEFNLAQRQSRARARREFIESRVQKALAELRESENALREFHERNRLWEGSPTLRLEEARLQRQVNVANEVYLTLRREYETARIDEVNNTPVITVVDSAVPPRVRHWPRRTAMVVSGGVIGAGLGLFLAGVLELLAAWSRRNPRQSTALQEAISGTTEQVRQMVKRPFARQRTAAS